MVTNSKDKLVIVTSLFVTNSNEKLVSQVYSSPIVTTNTPLVTLTGLLVTSSSFKLVALTSSLVTNSSDKLVTLTDLLVTNSNDKLSLSQVYWSTMVTTNL